MSAEVELLEPLPRGTLAALERAVTSMSYGTSCDDEIKQARQALAAVRRQQRALRHLLRHVADVRGAVSKMQ